MARNARQTLESQTLETVRNRYRDCREAYLPWAKKWVRNYNFSKGEQFTEVDDNLRAYYFDTEDDSMPQIVTNRLRALAETAIAKIVPDEFVPDSELSGFSVDARSQAAGQNQLLLLTGRRVRITELLRKATMDLLCTGRAILKTSWVSTSKADPPAEGLMDLEDLLAWGGYIHTYSVHPLRFLPCPWSTDSHIPWVVEVHTFHKDQMEELFEPPPGYSRDNWVPWQGAEVASQVEMGTAGLPSAIEKHPRYLDDCYIVYEMFDAPCQKYPRGRHVKATSSMVLYDSLVDPEQPVLAQLPYSAVFVSDGDSGLMADGVLGLGVPAQLEMNNLISKATKNLNEYLDSPWIGEGNITKSEEWSGGGKMYVKEKGTATPSKMPMPSLPQEFFGLLGVFTANISETVGINAPLNGARPPNIDSARGLDTLAAMDEAKLKRLAAAVISLYGDWARKTLAAYKNNVQDYSIPLTFMDSSVRYDVVSFFLDKIRVSNVQVKPIPGYLLSPAEHRRNAQLAVQLGVITDPEEKLEAFGLPNSGSKHDQEIVYSREENRAMRAGHPVSVRLYDLHPIHIDVHRMWLVSDEAVQARATREGQMVIAIFEAHLEDHMRRMQQAMAPAVTPGRAGDDEEDAADEGVVNPSLQGASPEMMTADSSGVQTGGSPVRPAIR